MSLQNSLPAYVEVSKDELVRKSALAGKSANDFNIQTGVKTVSEIVVLNTDVVFGDGKECGWNEAGTSTVSARQIKAAPIKINMSFCDKKLMASALQHEVRVAAGQKTLPFEEQFINDVLQGINDKIEKITWQGDTVSGADATLKTADGLIKLLDSASGVIKPSAGANIVESIDAVFMAIPSEIMDKAVIYVSPSDYRAYLKSLQDANLFHYSADGLSNLEVNYPGSLVKIKVAPGMPNGNIVAMDPANAYRGTDLLGDEDKFEFWYSQDNREFRLAVEFTFGVQVAFPSQCVLIKSV